MTRVRLLTILLGSSLLLGALLWLLNSLLSLYANLAILSPTLAVFLIGLLLALFLALVAALIYYIVLFVRPPHSSARPTVSTHPVAAADAALHALQQQVAQIQDEVTRQALLERSQTIESILAEGAFHLVVFGAGSVGKTSLINALLGQMVGQVGAPMGTTSEGETYTFHLEGVEREIWITDTPGLLESSGAGILREARARQLATEADILLMVTDNDLHRAEYEALAQLAAIGKRSLLILNKSDRYRDEDREAILARLRQQGQGILPPEDVIAVAANPPAVHLITGEVCQPDPDLFPLLKRIVAILQTEGEVLLAENILLQFQRLSNAAREWLEDERQQQANQIIERFQWIGAGVVAMTPLPVVDLLATAAVNAQMVVELGRVYGCEMNLERGKELALSLAKTLVSLGIVRGAIELFSITLQTNIGTFLIGKAVQGATAAYLIRIAGKSFIEYFRRNQTWGDEGIAEIVQEQFQLNRRDEFVQTFIQQAIVRVVQPLTGANSKK